METLASIIAQNGATGLASVTMIILAWLLYKLSKDKDTTAAQFAKMVKADQESREAQTEAITKLTETIAHSTTQTQNDYEHCETIRVCLVSQLDRLALMQAIDEKLKKWQQEMGAKP